MKMTSGITTITVLLALDKIAENRAVMTNFALNAITTIAPIIGLTSWSRHLVTSVWIADNLHYLTESGAVIATAPMEKNYGFWAVDA